MSAGLLVLLAGDVILNPGPMKNSAIVCPGYGSENYHLKCLGSEVEVSGCCPHCSVLPTNDISDSKEFHLSIFLSNHYDKDFVLNLNSILDGAVSL